MNIDIQALGFSLTEALHEYVQRHINFALSTRNQYIRRVRVWLSDINGPRGGLDKQCQIQVELTQLPDVVIETTEGDLYAAINRAADRAGRTVQRRLSRQRIKDRNIRPPVCRT